MTDRTRAKRKPVLELSRQGFPLAERETAARLGETHYECSYYSVGHLCRARAVWKLVTPGRGYIATGHYCDQHIDSQEDAVRLLEEGEVRDLDH